MNIEQYREMKAQIEADENNTTQEEVVEEVESEAIEEVETEEVKTEEVVDDHLVEIDGQKLTLEDLKQGYLRQADYTQKTQEVAQKRKEIDDAIRKLEVVKAQQPNNQTQQNFTAEDMATRKVVELEEKLYDLMLNQELDSLSRKYEDFDKNAVVDLAYKKNLTNLEDAYSLWKTSQPVIKEKPIDVEALKKQMREEIEKEYRDTRTTVGTKSTKPVKTNDAPDLTPVEKRVARNMKMTEKEYYTWKTGARK